MSLAGAICLGTSGFECSGVWIIMALLFFASAILKKQLDEGFGIDFSLPISVVGGILGFAIPFIIFGSFKWSFAIGLVLMLAGGFVGPYIAGWGEE